MYDMAENRPNMVQSYLATFDPEMDWAYSTVPWWGGESGGCSRRWLSCRNDMEQRASGTEGSRSQRAGPCHRHRAESRGLQAASQPAYECVRVFSSTARVAASFHQCQRSDSCSDHTVRVFTAARSSRTTHPIHFLSLSTIHAVSNCTQTLSSPMNWTFDLLNPKSIHTGMVDQINMTS